ncbi:MAG: DUF1285 domain-containing protein [Idiomarina sp.]|nr:DUF1285 domain-containing protein [Idiomarina sp.]
MNLEALQASLEKRHRAPVERWDPPFCGSIPLTICANGEWHYHNSPIQRPALVQLFASVLVRQDDQYFLVTPAEKVAIEVEDLPFLVTEWQEVEADEHTWIQVTTQIGEQYILNDKHPLVIHDGRPAVQVRDDLLARVHRNVYYQWVSYLKPARQGEAEGFYLQSGTHRFLVQVEG